jgi:hypothetical protein
MEETDLAFIIECEANFCNNWMSFISWYSINKNISDAKVFISVPFMGKFFNWANNVGVKIFRNQFVIDRPIIKVIKPSIMAVRTFSGNLDICSSKTDISNCLVDYKYGCGKFELDKWSSMNYPPFNNAIKKFSDFNITINEFAILNIWEQACFAYKQIVGGPI